MPQVSTQEFERLPLQVHTFLTGVPFHDVWSIDLPRWRAGVTLVEFLRTAGNCLSTLVETATAYRFYLAVYVGSVSRFTPFYMALIDPFRKMIVYPSLLRSVRARWNQAFGTDGKYNNLNCRCDKHMLPFTQP